MDKDLEKCGCSSEEKTCGCGGHHDHEDKDHECCGGHGHGDDHECGCGHDHDDEESFVVDLEDDNGNIVTCPIIDAFKFEEKEYLLAQSPEDDSVYLFRTEDEELVVPDEEEFDRVSEYYQNELVDED